MKVRPRGSAKASGRLGRLLDRGALQQGFGAVAGGLLDFDEGGEMGHDDGRRNAQPRGVTGDVLPPLFGGQVFEPD